MQFNFYEDNRHGWLEVPIAKLKELGIERDVSEYSYLDSAKGVAYLEEDDDMELFLEKCPEAEWIKTETVEHSFIRDLESYTRFPLTGLETVVIVVKELYKHKFRVGISQVRQTCVIYASCEERNTAIAIVINESSMSLEVDRTNRDFMSVGYFTKKIDNQSKKDVESVVFKACTYYV